MNHQTTNPNPTNESTLAEPPAARCQKRTRNGRCRLPVAGPSSTFCPEHSRAPSQSRNSADLSALLTEGLSEFKSAVPINDFLSRLLLHQAEGRIPPRRAAVMAYTANLLLRTLPVIDRELHPPDDGTQQIIFDLPRPKRD